jgi:hypothetical protein
MLPSTVLAPRRRLLLNLALLILLGLFVGWLVLVTRAPHAAASPPPHGPQSSALERATGVRFTRVVVVGDGGLVTVFYEVVDPERATRLQADRDHPPRLSSDARRGGTQRASIMRAGHQMRAGQTYYFVYENTKGAIRPGEHVDITYGGHTLREVPVL